MSSVLWKTWLIAVVAAVGFVATAHSDSRREAARGAPDASWAVLRLGLLSRDYSDRLLTTQVLGELPGSEDWLARALSDPEHDVRVAAVDALKRIGSSRATQLLRVVRDDTTEKLDVRVLAAAALLQLGAK
jgi:HEAT repeat protein